MIACAHRIQPQPAAQNGGGRPIPRPDDVRPNLVVLTGDQKGLEKIREQAWSDLFAKMEIEGDPQQQAILRRTPRVASSVAEMAIKMFNADLACRRREAEEAERRRKAEEARKAEDAKRVLAKQAMIALRAMRKAIAPPAPDRFHLRNSQAMERLHAQFSGLLGEEVWKFTGEQWLALRGVLLSPPAMRDHVARRRHAEWFAERQTILESVNVVIRDAFGVEKPSDIINYASKEVYEETFRWFRESSLGWTISVSPEQYAREKIVRQAEAKKAAAKAAERLARNADTIAAKVAMQDGITILLQEAGQSAETAKVMAARIAKKYGDSKTIAEALKVAAIGRQVYAVQSGDTTSDELYETAAIYANAAKIHITEVIAAANAKIAKVTTAPKKYGTMATATAKVNLNGEKPSRSGKG